MRGLVNVEPFKVTGFSQEHGLGLTYMEWSNQKWSEKKKKKKKEKKKGSKDLAKDRNAWKSFINFSTNESTEDMR